MQRGDNMADYTQDYLLDKKIKIFQPLDGYRASSDAVMVSSLICNVKNADKILDIGSGTGAISLCLAQRFPQAEIIGLEIQAKLAELSNKSAEANRFENLRFINQDIREKSSELQFCSFAHVITNPPYSKQDMPSPNMSKALAHNHHDFSLKEWINFAIKMLRPQGYFYMINRAEAIDEILATIHGRLGEIKIIPLFSKIGQPAKRVLIQGRKDSKAPSKIIAGLIIHDETGNYTSKAEEILRLGKSLLD